MGSSYWCVWTGLSVLGLATAGFSTGIGDVYRFQITQDGIDYLAKVDAGSEGKL